MGFDVVYLPPVHPIGLTKRKGRNNTVTATADDVGSPWAIGAAAGGHMAVDPALGTVDDVIALRRAVPSSGASSWRSTSPSSARPTTRGSPSTPSGSPTGPTGRSSTPRTRPKKYQDIYPLDFESADWPDLWTALADVFRFWIDRGVTVFRVDNPHTKAFAFWEWALATLRTEHPETIFLAEAFTRPRVMERLAKIGFNQSYTYFTWRQSAWELTRLLHRPRDPHRRLLPAERLAEHARHPHRAAAERRARRVRHPGHPRRHAVAVLGRLRPGVRAARAPPVRAGSEEYLDSEKYQLRQWDLDRADSLAPLLGAAEPHPPRPAGAAHLRTLRFHHTDNRSLLCYSKTDPAGTGPPVLVVVNLDHGSASRLRRRRPAPARPALRVEYDVVDQLGGGTYRWDGEPELRRPRPWSATAHIFACAVPRRESSTSGRGGYR